MKKMLLMLGAAMLTGSAVFAQECKDYGSAASLFSSGKTPAYLEMSKVYSGKAFDNSGNSFSAVFRGEQTPDLMLEVVTCKSGRCASYPYGYQNIVDFRADEAVVTEMAGNNVISLSRIRKAGGFLVEMKEGRSGTWIACYELK